MIHAKILVLKIMTVDFIIQIQITKTRWTHSRPIGVGACACSLAHMCNFTRSNVMKLLSMISL